MEPVTSYCATVRQVDSSALQREFAPGKPSESLRFLTLHLSADTPQNRVATCGGTRTLCDSESIKRLDPWLPTNSGCLSLNSTGCFQSTSRGLGSVSRILGYEIQRTSPTAVTLLGEYPATPRLKHPSTDSQTIPDARISACCWVGSWTSQLS